MFKVLQSHEEREPKAVLKTQSKRAQKRLTRQEALREEAQRLNKSNSNDKAETDITGLDRPSTAFAADTILGQHAALCQGDLDPDHFHDLTAQLERVGLEPAGPTVDGGLCSGRCEPALLGCRHSGDLAHLRRHAVDSPPGPGPGSWPGPGSSMLGDGPGAWLARQGSAPPLCWQDPTYLRSPRVDAAAQTRGSRAAAGLLLRFGSGAGSSPDSATASASGGGGQPGSVPASRPNSGRLAGRAGQHHHRRPEYHRLQRQGRSFEEQREGEKEEAEEEFPELRSTLAASSSLRQQQQQMLQQAHRGGQLAHRRGPGGVVGRPAARNGAHHGGVKVLHAARPPTHPRLLRSSDCLRNGFGGGDEDTATNMNLSLLWDLLQGGLCLRGDVLAAEGADLVGLEPDAAAAIKRLIKMRYPEHDGPARGLSPDDMIAMMARAHKRQCKKTTAADTVAAPRRDWQGGGGGDADGDRDGDSDDEPHLYQHRDESKSWRRTVEWMKENDWVLVKDTDGKHHKYRRWLPNGQIQTQTVCCSPSDALRGIRNLQADLARKDAQANSVIRAWRREERERRRQEKAAAAQDG